MLAERTSIARREYMVVAAGAVVVVCCITSILASSLTTMDYMFKAVWATAGFGALGAFFSVALAIRDRSIGTDLQRGNNFIDSVTRILIGAISAAILYCLLRTELVQLTLGGKTILSALARHTDKKGIVTCTPPSDVMEYFVILLTFIAGFSERLVGDLLNKAAASAGAANNPLAGGSGPRPPAPPAGANEQNPRGTGPAAPIAAAAPAHRCRGVGGRQRRGLRHRSSARRKRADLGRRTARSDGRHRDPTRREAELRSAP